MEKEFTNRFMPNVKFKVLNNQEAIYLRIVTKNKDIFYGYKTNESGDFFTSLDSVLEYETYLAKEVSIYEAIPDLIPQGMRYNKELDKLVTDVVMSAYPEYLSCEVDSKEDLKTNHRSYNIGSSNYASLKIQPWDVWKDWKLDPWDADIVKRISRTKEIPGKSFQEARIEDYEKIKHICDEKISQLKEKNDN